MKIGIASDHRGYNLKEEIIKNLENKYEFKNLGTFSTDSVDYPDYAFKLCKEVVNKNVDFGIAICGSGIGISIACNKVKGIFCAKVSNKDEAKYTRLDNDSNVVAFSSDISLENAIDIVTTFVETKFSNEQRHINRINKIKDYEDGNYEC